MPKLQRLLTGAEARSLIRRNLWQLPTSGLARGYVQANLVIVEGSLAEAFETLCARNPQALPVLERMEPGCASPQRCAKDADLRTDIPKYRFYERGAVTRQVMDLRADWRDDWCAFLLGCSFSFDALLAEEGIPVRHVEEGCNVPMYETDRELAPVAPFSGRLVVSMRPIPSRDLDRVVELTQPFALAHGGPVHIGDPGMLGIADVARPDHGDPVSIRTDETPVFWACGVTSQQVATSSRLPLMVTHEPGHMFITDLHLEDLRHAPETGEG
jgi:uncharacterized protein YcsI (UPF0317 family)